MSDTPPPPYTRYAATPISPQDLAAAESELHRINKELESTADPEAYVESKKEVIDQCLSVACHHEHAAIIRRRGREEVLPTRYEWMCKYLQRRKDRMQEKIRRGVNGVVTGDLLRHGISQSMQIASGTCLATPPDAVHDGEISKVQMEDGKRGPPVIFLDEIPGG
ncbi:hypothetical protein P167DRAFT_545575 [Morchella conica CCBAS932]|uniref:Uncharacterized protein n=1 Tax=Morchella conica CCBAS932 TaxID=1392247 RepID=A0A3N4KSS1_9PEZI|nr:hypothetical protein P167DRAFT_545575 [Morchella conica CCBAS932]